MSTRVRVIPLLLLADRGMVKTVRFGSARYLGDPINAVRIFNDKMADELILLDIEATSRGTIDFDWVEDIVSEAFMPVAYGGGIRSAVDIAELLARGVEKVVINTAAWQQPALISEAAARFGSQSIVVALDVKKDIWKRRRVYVRGATVRTHRDPAEAAAVAEARGAGEIMITSVPHEGTFAGYDLPLLKAVSSAVAVPVIANGGAGRIPDFARAVTEGGCSAVAASSLFVFAAKGEGVLITYPSQDQLMQDLWSRVA